MTPLIICCLGGLLAKHLVLLGPSQAGKSSFINTIAGRALASVGSGAGLSVTQECKEYVLNDSLLFPGETLNIIDVPGFGDNLSNVENEVILGNIRETIKMTLQANLLETAQDKTTIDGILLFEPLDNDSSQLHKTLERALSLFGETLKGSSVMLFTKPDMAPFSGRKPDGVACDAFGLRQCCWQSTGISPEDIQFNIGVLKGLLADLKPYEIEGMDKVLHALHQKAQLACEQQEVPIVKVNVMRTRTVEKPGFATETKEIVTYEETTEAYTVDVSHEIPGPGLDHFMPIVRQAIASGQVYSMPGYDFALLYSTLNAARNEFSRIQQYMAVSRQFGNDFLMVDLGHANTLINAATEALIVAVAKAHVESGVGRTFKVRKEERIRPGAPKPIIRQETVQVPTTIYEDEQYEEETWTEGTRRDVSEFEPEAKQAMVHEIRRAIQANIQQK